jgi:Rps23 Pro-64 3,4-dihydroxylase Tpa1-like proline 4-hydroxylase
MLHQTLSAPDAPTRYAAAKPFGHMAVDGAFEPSELVAVRGELEQLEFTPKETDLYRLTQSPDLSNLQPGTLPALSKTCDLLYSPKTRDLISKVAGCGPLSDRVDLAGAVYTSGSHLLVHDDVIDTRKISFIVYLTREEDKWTEADGGCLELYPTTSAAGSAAVPELIPAATVVPVFNRLAFFTVEAGVSYHAVQEVAAMEKDRISIQGWYHAADGSRADAAIAGGVKELRKQVQRSDWVPYTLAIPPPKMERKKKTTLEVPQISTDDLEALQGLGVHPMYLDPENMVVLAHAMKRQGMVRLANFLLPPLAKPVEEAIAKADEDDNVGLGSGVPNPRAGCRDGWELVGPAHVRRCLELSSSSEKPAAKAHRSEAGEGSGPTLERMFELMQDNLFRSEVFARFVAALASTSCSGTIEARRDAVRRFRPGLDYSLATMPADTQEIDVRLTFCNKPADDVDQEDEEKGSDAEEAEEAEEEEEEEDLWESCEVGGFDSYIQAVEGDSAVVAGDEDAVANLPCQSNCLTVAVRGTDQMHFVKYVQAVAPSSRYEAETVFRLDA